MDILERIKELTTKQQEIQEEIAALKSEYSHNFPPLRSRVVNKEDTYHITDHGVVARCIEDDDISSHMTSCNLFTQEISKTASQSTRILWLLNTCKQLFCPNHVPSYITSERVIRYDAIEDTFYSVPLSDGYAPYDVIFPNEEVTGQVCSYLRHLADTGELKLFKGEFDI